MVLTKDYNEVRHQLALKLMLSEVWNDIFWTRSYAKMLVVSVSVQLTFKQRRVSGECYFKLLKMT